MKRLMLILALLLAALAYANDALAQMGGMGGGMGGRSGRGRGDSSQSGSQESRKPAGPPDANSLAQIDFRISQLRAALNLTPVQVVLWESFAARAHALAEDVARERGLVMDLRPGADPGPRQGLAHVHQAVETARNRLALLSDAELAVKDLYQALTPEQKALADARLPAIVAPRALAAMDGDAARQDR